MIAVKCQQCQTPRLLQDAAAGQTLPCARCGYPIEVAALARSPRVIANSPAGPISATTAGLKSFATVAAGEQAGAACYDMLRRSTGGNLPPLEAYVNDLPSIANDAEYLLAVIGAHAAARRSLGERPLAADYAALFPVYAVAIHDRFRPLSVSTDEGTPQTRSDATLHLPELPSWEEFAFLLPSSVPGDLGRLGHYRVTRILGQGGMGVVFAGFDTRLHRDVAVKVLRMDRFQNADHRARFEREGRAAASLVHDNVVPVFDVGSQNGMPYLVMPLLTGRTLKDWLMQAGPLDADDVAHLGRDVARGLAAAHARGFIHRDVKASNLWIEPTTDATMPWRARLFDFGLARDLNDSDITQTGHIVGTPAYMAPEQVLGQPLDPRCDFFSLGVVLYEAATGKSPFDRGTQHPTTRAVTDYFPPPPNVERGGVPANLSNAIMRLLAKKPDDRPPNADAFLTMIDPTASYKSLTTESATIEYVSETASANQPNTKRRIITIIACILLLLIAVIAVLTSTF